MRPNKGSWHLLFLRLKQIKRVEFCRKNQKFREDAKLLEKVKSHTLQKNEHC